MGPLQRRDLEQHLTSSYRLTALLPSEHRLAGRKSLRLQDIAEEPLVLGLRAGWPTYRALIDRVFEAEGLVPRIGQEVYESFAIFGLVSAGMGISIYPECVSTLRPRNVVAVPLRGVTQRVETVALWHSQSQSLAARNFVEFLLAAKLPTGTGIRR